MAFLHMCDVNKKLSFHDPSKRVMFVVNVFSFRISFVFLCSCVPKENNGLLKLAKVT